MNTLSDNQVRSLHFRSTFVGSILSGIGVGAGISLLILIAVSVSFNPDRPTDAQIWREVAGVTAIYALGGALVVAAIGFILHGLVRLLAQGSPKGHAGVSHVVAACTGALLGSGIWVWQLMLLSPNGTVGFVLGNIAMSLVTGLLVLGSWNALSSLLQIRQSETGQSLSWSLGLTAGIFSIVPWAFLLIQLIRP